MLTPDFRGEEMPLARVIAERPDVFNHNVETVPRLYPLARRGSRFLRSCRVLRNAKEMGGDEVVTKSGLMTGLGESKEELLETFGVLREHGVQVLTVGQYLRPTRDHLPGGALLAPRRVRRARARGLRDGLRVGRGRPARALELPRRADPGRPRAGVSLPRSRGASPLARRRALAARCHSPGRRAIAGRPLRLEPTAREVAAARDRRAPSTWSAASSPEARRPAAVERYDIGRDRWSADARRCRSRSTTPTAVRPPRQALRARRLRGARDRSASPTGALLRYDPRRDRWRRLPPAPTPRAAHAAAAIGGPPVRGGGANDSGSLRSLEIYDVARRRWTSGPSFPGPARNHTTGVASGGRFYVLAGRDAGNLAAAERYDPRRRPLGGAAADCAPRAAASRRRALRDGRIVGVRRRGADAGRHDDRRGRALRPAHAALAPAARHAHAAPRPRRGGARQPRIRASRAAPRRASRSRTRSSSWTSAR